MYKASTSMLASQLSGSIVRPSSRCRRSIASLKKGRKRLDERGQNFIYIYTAVLGQAFYPQNNWCPFKGGNTLMDFGETVKVGYAWCLGEKEVKFDSANKIVHFCLAKDM